MRLQVNPAGQLQSENYKNEKDITRKFYCI